MSPHSLRARVLAEWRGLPEEFAKPDRTVAVSDAIAAAMKKLGLGERLREEEVLGAWARIVGEFFARHSSPQRLKDGVLYVHVLQPTVHFELERVWKRDILEKLKKRFGGKTVREIRFRIG
jgi:predicted nucleic acid-binding Zn ribbon protein